VHLLLQRFTGADQSNDDPDNKLTDARIHVKVRANDFLTNEEAVRGITEEFFSSFPGISGIVSGKGDAAEKKNYFDKVVEYLFFKKRFEHRTIPLGIAYNPHLAIGFPIVIIDYTSEFNNTIVGYLHGIRHSISPNSAGTSLMITYARELDEVQEMTGSRIEPPLPPWFDSARWGKIDKATTASETARIKKSGYAVDEAARKNGVIQFDKISDTYMKLIGVESITHSSSSTSQDKRQSTEGAVAAIVSSYKQATDAGEDTEKEFIRKFIKRPMVDMETAFLFLNAKPSTDKSGAGLTSDFLVFKGTDTGPSKANTFDGILTTAQKTTLYGKGFEYLTDQEIIAKKQEIVHKYADELKYSSGQRG
jgi:hypothetical protein